METRSNDLGPLDVAFLVAMIQMAALSVLGGASWISGIRAGHHIGDEFEGSDLVAGASLVITGLVTLAVAWFGRQLLSRRSPYVSALGCLLVILEAPVALVFCTIGLIILAGFPPAIFNLAVTMFIVSMGICGIRRSMRIWPRPTER